MPAKIGFHSQKSTRTKAKRKPFLTLEEIQDRTPQEYRVLSIVRAVQNTQQSSLEVLCVKHNRTFVANFLSIQRHKAFCPLCLVEKLQERKLKKFNKTKLSQCGELLSEFNVETIESTTEIAWIFFCNTCRTKTKLPQHSFPRTNRGACSTCTAKHEAKMKEKAEEKDRIRKKNAWKKQYSTKVIRKIGAIRGMAKKRGKDFTLNPEYAAKLLVQSCVYCGKENDDKNINGIDRIDSSHGYIYGNVQTCCAVCNRMKNDLPENQFFEHLKQIISYTRI